MPQQHLLPLRALFLQVPRLYVVFAVCRSDSLFQSFNFVLHSLRISLIHCISSLTLFPYLLCHLVTNLLRVTNLYSAGATLLTNSLTHSHAHSLTHSLTHSLVYLPNMKMERNTRCIFVFYLVKLKLVLLTNACLAYNHFVNYIFFNQKVFYIE